MIRSSAARVATAASLAPSGSGLVVQPLRKPVEPLLGVRLPIPGRVRFVLDGDQFGVADLDGENGVPVPAILGKVRPLDHHLIEGLPVGLELDDRVRPFEPIDHGRVGAVPDHTW